MRRRGGYTLIELVTTLVVGSVLLSLAVPAFENLVLDSRRTADINAFVTAVQLARSESAKRGRPAVLCKTVDWVHCNGADAYYEQGWMVFVDEDGDSPPFRDENEQLLFGYEPVTAGTIRSNRARYVFRPYWRRSTNGTITFCDRRGSDAARAVIISYTGRPRVADRGPGRPLVCAS
ncbi:MAG: GspH/FimT family pseudopilin [Gammaproteobacteria bacterium]|nr:GspH/FimT family pseudopilin [Gammaproteobacteria bacterium]